MSLVVVDQKGWIWHGDEVVRGETEVLARAKGNRVVVGLGSELCFAGVVDSGGSTQEMLYRLEDILPVAAEDVIAGFIGNGKTALGVAIERDRLQTILEKLSGAHVIATCPLALLAIGGASDGVVRMGEDIVKVAGGKPLEWTWGINNGSKGIDAIPEAMAFARKVLSGQARPAVDLREVQTGALTSHAGLLAVAAVVMLCVISMAMWVRAWRYDARSLAMEGDEQQAYQSVMKGEVPADMVARLESEVRRLEGGAVSTDLPPRVPGSAVMVDILGNLPANLKLEITELRLEGETLSLAGRVTTHQDAEAIAGALRAGGQFEIGSPGTEQLADGSVSFSISGTRKGAAKTGGAQ